MKSSYAAPTAQFTVFTCEDVIQSSPIKLPGIDLHSTRAAELTWSDDDQ